MKPELDAADERTRNSGSQTLSRGLQIVEVLAASNEPLSAPTIANLTGLGRPVVYRMLTTLKEHGLLRSDLPDGKYALGLGLLSLARRVNAGFREHAHPLVAKLADELKATAFIGMAEGDEVVCFIAREPHNTVVSIRYREGMRRPKSLGASGKVMRYLENPQSDDAGVAMVRERGYAVSKEELEEKTSALSVPISRTDRTLHFCLTVVFPSLEPRTEAGAVQRLLETAEKIAAGLD